MKMKLFTEWLKDRNLLEDGGGYYQQKIGNLQGVITGLHNSLANMKNDLSFLSSGLEQALKQVADDPQASSIVREMLNVASQFMNDMRNKGLYVYDHRPGQASTKPRPPYKGERGFDEFQQMYFYYDKKLRLFLDQLTKVAQTHTDNSNYAA